MRHQELRLGKTRGTRLDSTLPVCTHCRGGHCKPQSHCRVFVTLTGLDWTHWLDLIKRGKLPDWPRIYKFLKEFAAWIQSLYKAP